MAHRKRIHISVLKILFLLTFTAILRTFPAKAADNSYQPPDEYQTIIKIGGVSQYQNLKDAVNAIPDNAGNVAFYLKSGITIHNESIQVPTDKGITSFTIDSESPVTIMCEDSKVFAWGIPFIIGENVELSQLSVFGGGYAINGENSNLDQTLVIVYGTIGNLYGGGYALDRSAANVDQANLAVYGVVQYKVYGGGYAVGTESISSVNNTSIFIDDRAVVGKDLYYGGHAASRCIDLDPTRQLLDSYGDYKMITRDCGKEGGTVEVKHVNIDCPGRIKGQIHFTNYLENGAYQASELTDISTSILPSPPGYRRKPNSKVVQEMVLAPGQQCDSLLCAMEKVNKDTTELNITLTHDASENYAITIPYSGCELEKVTINAEKPVKISFRNVGFFANGIDFTLGENVTFSGAQIYAGANSSAGKNEQIQKASVTIHGMVDEVYGGSLVNNEGSYSDVLSTNILITGSVQKNVYGGGYAYVKNAKSIVGDVTMTLGKTSVIRGNLIFGGNAQNNCTNENGGQNCDHGGYTYTGNVNAAVFGKIYGNILNAGLETEGAHSDFGDVDYVRASDPEMMGVTYPQIIRVGVAEEITTLQKALQMIRYPGGDVEIILSSNLNINENIEIPDYLEIKSLKIDSDREGVNRSLDFHGRDFFANGIPFHIGKNIVFTNSYLYGGSFASFGEEINLENVNLLIDGYVDNVFLGGKAIGAVNKTISKVDITSAALNLNGTIQNALYCGGNSVSGGFTNIHKAQINIFPRGRINLTLYTYGLASSIINQPLDMKSATCFRYLSECQKYASTQECNQGYAYNNFVVTKRFTDINDREVTIGYKNDKMYCVQLNMNLKNNKSLSIVDTVVLNIDGTVAGRINCGSNAESSGSKAMCRTILPAELCSPN